MDESTLYFGTAGWSYPDWHGVFYPVKAGKTSKAWGGLELSYAVRFLDALEINASFYRVPNPRQAERWLEAARARRHFLFSMKLWQGFTHAEAPPSSGGADTENFIATARILAQENRLACILAQFPWSFKFAEAQTERIQRLADAFREFPMVMEVRHASWMRDEYFALLEQCGCSFCNIDQPVIGASIPPTARVTSPLGYVRLHGRRYDTWFAENEKLAERYDYLYPKEELAEWAERIREIARKANRTLVIANNHFRAKAVTASMELKSLVTDCRPEAPTELLDAYPHLRDICQEVGQIEPPTRQMDFFGEGGR